MKRDKKQNTAEKFERFPLIKTPAILWLSVAALVLSVAGIALSAVRIYRDGLNSFYDWLKNPFLIAVCLFAIAVVSSLLIRCEYRVSDTELISCYGFVKNKLPISQITSATSDTENNKIYLTLENVEGQLTVITSREKREDLIRALLKAKPSIDYGFTLRENPDKND